MDPLVSQVPQVFLEIGAPQEALGLDLRAPQERRVSQECQEDPEVQVHQELKVNQAYQSLKRAYQDPEDWMASQDCLVLQVPLVSLVGMVSLVYQGQRVTQDSQGLDFQDRQELKDSQVFLASQELRENQADQALMDSPANLDFLDPRENLALGSLAHQVYLEYPEVKVFQDQREIQVSLVVLVHLDEMDLMVLQDLKVNLVHQVFLELVAHLDLPPLAHWGHLVHLAHLAQWDHQDSLEEMERRETLALQV